MRSSGYTRWLPSPEAPTLVDNEVHVWRSKLNQLPIALPDLLQALSPDERARADRFLFQEDRDQYIKVRGLFRLLLSQYTGLPPERLVFEYGPNGKPALTVASGGDRIGFNRSHSAGLAVFAIAPTQKIGVDIERMRRDVVFTEVASTIFSVRERQVLAALPKEWQAKAFYDCWTRKEAFVKATGAGLSMGMERFDVSLRPDEPPALLYVDNDPQASSKWMLVSIKPSPNYAGALAIETRDWQFFYWDLDLEKMGGWKPNPIEPHEPFSTKNGRSSTDPRANRC